MTGIPAYPRHLKPAERRAVLTQAARDMAEATMREAGLARDAVQLDTLIGEAANQVTIAWLTERVASLEAEVAALRPKKGRVGA